MCAVFNFIKMNFVQIGYESGDWIKEDGNTGRTFVNMVMNILAFWFVLRWSAIVCADKRCTTLWRVAVSFLSALSKSFQNKFAKELNAYSTCLKVPL